jgi:uracil-DNA glycosylase
LVDMFWLSQQGQALLAFLQQRLQAGAQIYPPEPLRALFLSPLPDVKVVILGQDPYHGMGQAEGLAFSVPSGVAAPPSLRNIFKELQRDLGQAPPFEASLSPWAAHGVLLLNTCLTVEDGLPASHTKQGWEALTDAIIQAIAEYSEACVFMLWGAHAQSKATLIAQATSHKPTTCLVLQANHPSPLSALRGPQPFIGCGHFSKAQQWLQSKGMSMDWCLDR